MITLRRTVYASMLLYAIACALPALTVEDTFNPEIVTWFGVILLILGWLGVLLGQLAWLANLSLFLAWLLAFLKRKWAALPFSLLAIGLSVDLRRFNQQQIWSDEAGNCCFVIRSVGPGTYLWYASMAVLVLGLIISLIRPERSADNPRPSL